MRKKLVLKALTDPKFRKMLQENPEGSLNAEELSAVKGGAYELLAIVNKINADSSRISDMIFCVTFPDDDDTQLA